ncbi:hypothetical protein N0V88_004828 [Collariella sp. IMI 366227]|nr:hypothetical protein N0V88_004828 [Collariella sp. IMI 366227]
MEQPSDLEPPVPPYLSCLSEDGTLREFDVAADIEAPSQSHLLFDQKARESMLVKARQLIQAKYDKGIPFFSKDVFRSAVEQFDRCLDVNEPAKSVTLSALDGTMVRFNVNVGSEFEICPPYKVVKTKPALDYYALEYLTSPELNDIPDRVYLSVSVLQATEYRHVETGEVAETVVPADYDTARARFEREREFWAESAQFARLRSILTSSCIIPHIRNVVAFGCSSMSRQYEDRNKASLSQHSLILEVRDVVMAEREGSPEIRCFAQDPAYTSVDEQVLGEAGITVLDDPRAWLAVDDGSVVVSISPDIPMANGDDAPGGEDVD